MTVAKVAHAKAGKTRGRWVRVAWDTASGIMCRHIPGYSAVRLIKVFPVRGRSCHDRWEAQPDVRRPALKASARKGEKG